MLAFQPAINIKINEIFYILLFILGLRNQVYILPYGASPFGLATFQKRRDPVWLLAITLDNEAIEQCPSVAS